MIRRLFRLAGTIIALAAVIAALALVAFVAGFGMTVVHELGWSPVRVGALLIGFGVVLGVAIAGIFHRSRTPDGPVVTHLTARDVGTGMKLPDRWVDELAVRRRDEERREGIVR